MAVTIHSFFSPANIHDTDSIFPTFSLTDNFRLFEEDFSGFAKTTTSTNSINTTAAWSKKPQNEGRWSYPVSPLWFINTAQLYAEVPKNEAHIQCLLFCLDHRPCSLTFWRCLTYNDIRRYWCSFKLHSLPPLQSTNSIVQESILILRPITDYEWLNFRKMTLTPNTILYVTNLLQALRQTHITRTS